MPVKAIFSDRAIINPEDEQHSIEQFNRSDGINAVSTLIITNDKMCRDGYSRDFRTIQVAHRMELLYELGDALEVNPQNDEKAVSEFLHAYCNDFGDHTLVKLHSFGIDGDISLLGLFTHVLDLFGKPSKHFMQQLATFASDEEERNAMLDPGFLKTATKETGLTITGALLRFKKAVPPLPALLAMIPVVKPRTYSIASAPLASPASIELLVLIDTWWCDEGLRYGLTCNMLRKLKSGDRLWCRIKAGSMERPLPVQSVLCAGIGSGIAPSMAFLWTASGLRRTARLWHLCRCTLATVSKRKNICFKKNSNATTSSTRGSICIWLLAATTRRTRSTFKMYDLVSDACLLAQ